MKLFVIILATLFLFIGCKKTSAADSNWTKSEHNFTVQAGDWGIDIRNQFRSDYDHIEPSYQLGNKWYGIKVAFRIAEENGAREYRPKVDHQLISWTPKDVVRDDGTVLRYKNFWLFSLGHRIEFRNYEKESTNDYWRYRLIGKTSVDLNDRFGLWGKVQPRWNLGNGQENDITIDSIKNQAGVKINLENDVSFSPYIEVISSHDLKQESAMFGTSLKLSF